MSDQLSEETPKKEFTELIPAPSQEVVDKDLIDVKPDVVVGSELQQEIGDEMSRVGFENLKKLCLLNEYDIAGVHFVGKKLGPKQIKELRKIDQQFDDALKTMTDVNTIEEQELARLSAKAFIHLGMTPEQFEETDIPMLQTVITARDMRKRGWFRLQ